MILTCPQDTPCNRCLAIIPAGVQAQQVHMVAKFAPHLPPITVWYHLACAPHREVFGAVNGTGSSSTGAGASASYPTLFSACEPQADDEPRT
jgi:hypothetical protein